MLSLLETQIKAAVAGAVTFPTRWKGDAWASSLSLSDGDMPLTTAGLPAAAIEAEISGFDPKRSPGRKPHRQTIAEGHLRLILSDYLQAGTADINAEYGRIDTALARTTIYYNDLTVRRIYLMDIRVDADAAFYEEGNRMVRMLTIPWVFSWFS